MKRSANKSTRGIITPPISKEEEPQEREEEDPDELESGENYKSTVMTTAGGTEGDDEYADVASALAAVSVEDFAMAYFCDSKTWPQLNQTLESPFQFPASAPVPFVPFVDPDLIIQDEILPLSFDTQGPYANFLVSKLSANENSVFSFVDSALIKDEFLNLLPADILHEILEILDVSADMSGLEGYLVSDLLIPESAKRLPRNIVALVLTSKVIYDKCFRRGGIPTLRPMYCLTHCARWRNYQRLETVLNWIGVAANAYIDDLLNELLNNSQLPENEIIQCIDLFLERGASLKLVSYYGTPIHIAARRAKLAVFKHLIDRGANPEKDVAGQNAFAGFYNSGFTGELAEAQEYWNSVKKDDEKKESHEDVPSSAQPSSASSSSAPSSSSSSDSSFSSYSNET